MFLKKIDAEIVLEHGTKKYIILTMKKILPILIAFLLTTNLSYSIEEVVLEKDQQLLESIVLDVQEKTANNEKTLQEKLNDIYHLEIEQIDKPSFLFKEILTKHYDEKSAWESMQLWGAYGGHLNLNFAEGESFNGDYAFDVINVGLDGKLKNHNGDFRIMFNYSPLSSRNVVQNLFADMYVGTNKVPHHRFWVGNTRPPVGMEGGYSPYVLPFVARSQISRNFGTVRKLGARVSGDYSLVDYDFGIYSSDTYFQEFFPGTEFVGWVNLKPLGKTDGKYGKLKIGGGVQSGDRNTDYTVTGAYVGYEYKKLLLNFEWVDANGYNGPVGYAVDKHASGFYSTLAYRFTPKLQGLIRYDEFDPNKNIAHNNKREYSVGFNYFIKGQALKLIMNYVFCQNDATKDSHRILLGTQILF